MRMACGLSACELRTSQHQMAPSRRMRMNSSGELRTEPRHSHRCVPSRPAGDETRRAGVKGSEWGVGGPGGTGVGWGGRGVRSGRVVKGLGGVGQGLGGAGWVGVEGGHPWDRILSTLGPEPIPPCSLGPVPPYPWPGPRTSLPVAWAPYLSPCNLGPVPLSL